MSRAELTDLPIDMPLRPGPAGSWVLELPGNVIQLLDSGRDKAVYSGRLIFGNEGGRSIPLRLVLSRRPGPRTEKSAG